MSMSSTSTQRLSMCDARLVQLFSKVAESVDIIITEGHRELAAEAQNIAKGTSHLKDPRDCLHCAEPSLAVDVVRVNPDRDPHDPVDWGDAMWFRDFAQSYVKPNADALGLTIRWGGAWNDPKDWTLNADGAWSDLPHFEIHNV